LRAQLSDIDHIGSNGTGEDRQFNRLFSGQRGVAILSAIARLLCSFIIWFQPYFITTVMTLAKVLTRTTAAGAPYLNQRTMSLSILLDDH
jgi:hypothetical protein